MTESEARLAVVAEARSWIGTPYHHRAAVKGSCGGVDCGMLLIRVFADLGLIPDFDPGHYPIDWHMHRAEERYLGFVTAHAGPVVVPGPGDVIVFKWGRCFAHGGIITEAEPACRFVHAAARAGFVEETVLSASPLAARQSKYFSLWKAV
jgi:cell wall-associated NlpC family hydrolase